jgi:hypothetical protein
MVFLLASCRDDRGAPLPSEPYFETPATTPPAFDRDEVEAGLAEAVAVVPSLEAEEAIAIYRALRAEGDPTCPASYPYAGYEYWYAQCEAESGAVFSGYSYEYGADYGGGYVYAGVYLYGAIALPDGPTLSSTGEFASTTFGRGSEGKVRTVLDGVFDWSGEAAPGGWIARRLVPGITVVRERPGGAHVWRLDGGVSGFEGPADTVEFVDVTFDDGDGCTEPAGTISVRVAGGEWFDVTFEGDGQEDGEVTCDGCGRVANRGVVVGEACADFSAWTAP